MPCGVMPGSFTRISVESQWMRELLVNTHDRLVDWLVESALPLWSRNGLDRARGFTFEYLQPDGSPDRDSDRSLAVQAHQINAFSRAESKGWLQGMQADIEKMTTTASLLGTTFCRSDGFVHKLDKALNIVDPSYHAADHASFMTSSAAAWYAYRNGSELRRSYNIFEWLEKEYRHPAGGLVDRSAAQAHLRLSTQIQLCDAFLFIYRYSGKNKWLICATDFFALLHNKIYTGNLQSLAELRRTDWSPDPQNPAVLPESIFLLIALLHQVSDIDAKLRLTANEMYQNLMQTLWAEEASGLVPDRISMRAAKDPVFPCSSLIQLSRASLMEAVTGNGQALPILLSSIDQLFAVFLDNGVPGTITDRVDARRKPLDNRSYAGNLHHIVNLAIDLGDVLDERLPVNPAKTGHQD